MPWRNHPKTLRDHAIKAAAHYCVKNKLYAVAQIRVPVWNKKKAGYEFPVIPTHEYSPKFVEGIYEEIRDSLAKSRRETARILGPPFYPYWSDRENEIDFGFSLHPILRDYYFQKKAGEQWTVLSTERIQVHTVLAYHYLINREEDKFAEEGMRFRRRKCRHGALRTYCLQGCPTWSASGAR